MGSAPAAVERGERGASTRPSRRPRGPRSQRGGLHLPDDLRHLAARSRGARRLPGAHPGVRAQGPARGEDPLELARSRRGLRGCRAGVRGRAARRTRERSLSRRLPPLRGRGRGVRRLGLARPPPPQGRRSRRARLLPGHRAVGLQPGRSGQPAAGGLRTASATAPGDRRHADERRTPGAGGADRFFSRRRPPQALHFGHGVTVPRAASGGACGSGRTIVSPAGRRSARRSTGHTGHQPFLFPRRPSPHGGATTN